MSTQLRIPRAAVIAQSIAAASFLLGPGLAGCGGGQGDLDASTPRDAAFADAIEIGRDAMALDAAGDAAAATDAGVAMCASGECDPTAGTGCESTAVCVLDDRLPACVGAVGAGTSGVLCASELECAPGLACFRDGAGGVCARVCCPGDAMACDVGTRCSADGVLVTGVTTSWGRCAAPRACDPRTPDCPAREGCYIRYPEPGAECRFAGTAAVGDGCAVPEDCQPGLYCAGIGSPTCVRVCRLDDPRSCPSAEGTCVAQAYSTEGTGVCVAAATAW